jgi:hypothetical protein
MPTSLLYHGFGIQPFAVVLLFPAGTRLPQTVPRQFQPKYEPILPLDKRIV